MITKIFSIVIIMILFGFSSGCIQREYITTNTINIKNIPVSTYIILNGTIYELTKEEHNNLGNTLFISTGLKRPEYFLLNTNNYYYKFKDSYGSIIIMSSFNLTINTSGNFKAKVMKDGTILIL